MFLFRWPVPSRHWEEEQNVKTHLEDASFLTSTARIPWHQSQGERGADGGTKKKSRKANQKKLFERYTEEVLKVRASIFSA